MTTGTMHTMGSLGVSTLDTDVEQSQAAGQLAALVTVLQYLWDMIYVCMGSDWLTILSVLIG